ncbi:hypothetical protein [Streptomyces nanshensis]|uniref:hypothetical protein n=1 Tax=Streptomyces nanshensis TaxID=518642 RepID=UPI00099F4F2B|nr:hypothetical protein [Streptomyces nanshensis]
MLIGTGKREAAGGTARTAVRGAGVRAAAAVLGGVLLVGVPIAGTAGCGAQRTSGDAGDRPREITAAETALLASAQEELVGRCMERHGFRYWPAAPPTRDELREFPYAVDDLGWARRHGYGGDLQREASRYQRTGPNAQYTKGLSADRRRAYAVTRTGDGTRAVEVTAPNGVDIRQNRTGCLAQAQGRLYGDFREWFRLSTVVTNLPDHSGKIRRTALYGNAVEAWSACMKEKGHTYGSPSGLQTALEKAADGATPREAHRIEVRLATAEAACARSTPLSATVRTLEKHYAEADRAQYGADIDAHRRMQLSALQRARHLVQGSTQNAAHGK